VLQKLLRKARKGVRIIYVPGNHDEFLCDYYGEHFGSIEVVKHAIHAAADGRRYLIVARRPFRPHGHTSALARAARQQGLRHRDPGEPRVQRVATSTSGRGHPRDRRAPAAGGRVRRDPAGHALWSSLTLYRLETNVRSATTRGIVGAGGIG
jgi:UDP-2,3-diacylglucosamine pyrophosphatase LpxH